MTLNIKDVSARMKNVATAVEKGTHETVTDAAKKSKEIILAGSPDRLRNAGKKGAKLGAKVAVTGSGASVSARVKATGPWPLIESDIGAHRIAPKRERRGERAAGISTPYGVFASVHHPGTKGKHPWAKGVTRAEPVVAKEMSKKTANIAAAAFHG